MKKAGLLLLFLLVLNPASAQTEISDPQKLQQLYLTFGIGNFLNSAENMKNSGLAGSAQLNACFTDNFSLKAGILNTIFQDTQPASLKYKENENNTGSIPEHQIKSNYLMAGIRKVLNQNIHLKAFSGVSYNIYKEPVNVYQTNSIVNLVGFGPSYILDYETETHYKPGLIFQAEGSVILSSVAGLTLAAYYHYIPTISNGGFTLNLDLGILRPKK